MLGGSARPSRELKCKRSKGTKGVVKGGVASHACRSAVAPGPKGPAAPRSGGGQRSLAQGGWPGGGGGGVGGGPDPQAAGDRGWGGGRSGVRPCSDPRQGDRPPGRPRAKGLDAGQGGRGRGRLATGQWPTRVLAQQGGPQDVGEPQVEGVNLRGHLPPSRRGVGVGGGGGGLAGGVVVPHPAPPVQCHGVGPASGRLSLEEGEAESRAEVPVLGGSQPSPRPCRVGRHSGAPVSSCHRGAKY